MTTGCTQRGGSPRQRSHATAASSTRAECGSGETSERPWRARRVWQRERELDQIERVQLHDEMYGDDDVHRLSKKNAVPGSKTPLDSALRKVAQLTPVIR